MAKRKSAEALTAAARERAADLLIHHKNPQDLANLYAASWVEFWLALDNIDRNGPVCIHATTGAPVANPYVQVRNQAAANMAKLGRSMNAAPLWESEDLARKEAVEIRLALIGQD